jgi:Hemerythrin HHE cation binding domain.
METLQVLTRQHMEDKLKCRELMKDIQQQKDRLSLKQSIIQFWRNSVQKHVESEETFLFPFLQKHQFSREFINTLKREHDTIRTLAERLPFYEDGYQLYKAFIKLVEQHSRFEDEFLFPKMKDELPPQELAQLNMAMAR